MTARYEATFHTHKELWIAARHYQRLRQKDWRAGKHLDMATMLFVFLALEAYANYLGQVVASDAWKNERTRFDGPLAKVDYLAEICGLSIEKGRRPYQTLCALHKLRNRLAHGRPESFEREGKPSGDGAAFLESEISRAVSIDAADRALHDFETFVEDLHAAALRTFPSKRLDRIALDGLTAVGSVHG